MTDSALSQYLLFDFNGQKVAVTDMQIDENGLRTNWVILGETRHYTDEETDRLLAKAFSDLFEQMETPPEPDTEPTPSVEPKLEPEEPPVPEKPGLLRRVFNSIKELF